MGRYERWIFPEERKEINEWLRNIKENYNKDYDTDIRGQLLDMSKELGLPIDWYDYDKAWQGWYPKRKYITIKELKQILSGAFSNAGERGKALAYRYERR